MAVTSLIVVELGFKARKLDSKVVLNSDASWPRLASWERIRSCSHDDAAHGASWSPGAQPKDLCSQVLGLDRLFGALGWVCGGSSWLWGCFASTPWLLIFMLSCVWWLGSERVSVLTLLRACCVFSLEFLSLTE